MFVAGVRKSHPRTIKGQNVPEKKGPLPFLLEHLLQFPKVLFTMHHRSLDCVPTPWDKIYIFSFKLISCRYFVSDEKCPQQRDWLIDTAKYCKEFLKYLQFYCYQVSQPFFSILGNNLCISVEAWFSAKVKDKKPFSLHRMKIICHC